MRVIADTVINKNHSFSKNFRMALADCFMFIYSVCVVLANNCANF